MMKKVWKRVTTLAVTVVLILTAAVTAAAEDTTGVRETGTKGRITIGNAIAGQSYTIYKVFDLESYDTEKNAYTYKVNREWKSFVEHYTSARSENPYFTIDEQGYVVQTDQFQGGAIAEFAQEALAWAKEQSVSHVGTKTADTATVVFDGLELGYYLLDSTTGALCGLNTTDHEVTVREKNEVPEAEKLVKEKDNWQEKNTAAIGDTVEFFVDIKAKAGAENYVLHDTMKEEDGLTFAGNVRVVYIAAGTQTETAMAENTDYTFLKPGTEEQEKCTFEVGILKTLQPGDVVRIYYSAVINEHAEVHTDIVNEIRLQYGDGQYVTDQTTTNTYGLKVFKHDVKNVPLANASFLLSKKGKPEDAKTDAIRLIDKRNQIYRVAKPGEGGSVSEITTDETGRFEIRGLDAGTYYLHEIKAPAGYNKLKVPIQIVIGEDGTVTYRLDTKAGAGDSERFENAPGYEISVENRTGFELPTTGGMGTTIFYIVGILAIAAAIFYIATNRKRQEK